eukprot:7668586-Pyramimonas_sp.AAC.1
MDGSRPHLKSPSPAPRSPPRKTLRADSSPLLTPPDPLLTPFLTPCRRTGGRRCGWRWWRSNLS